MRYLLVILFLFLSSCSKKQPQYSNTDVVQTYYNGLNTADFDLLQTVLADSIILVEGGFETPMSQEDFYVIFQWDSVFSPHTTLHNVQEKGNLVKALVSTTSKRYAFLENNPFACETTFSIEFGKIRSHETGICPNEDREIWQSNRDSLVSWIDRHHPDLSGFINELSKNGAENYMQAIQFYQNR